MRALAPPIALLCAACSFKIVNDAATDGPPGGDAAGTPLRKRITIAPAAVMSALTEFPVWIVRDGDGDLMARASGSGSDIHFTGAGGAPIPYQIQRWTKSAGRLEAWVKVDLSDNQDTVIELRYGDPRGAGTPSPQEVFSNGFVAVWHLDDPIAAPDAAIADATGQYPGTGGGLAASDQVTARLGGGVDFDGTSKRINFRLPLTGNSEHTISAWVNQRTASGYDTIVTMGNPTGNQSRWLHARYNAGVSAGFFGNDWPDPGTLPNIDNTGWVLLHWTYKSNRQSRMYRNGVEVGSHTFNSNVNTQGADGNLAYAPAQWGVNGTDPCWLNGTLDEVRIATIDRSPEWIAAEHANQSSPQTFYTVGAEEPAP